MFIIKHRKIFISISAILVLLSFISLFVFGLDVGIDFKGGALTEVVYKDLRPTQEFLNKAILELDFGTVLLQPTGDLGYIVKSRSLSDPEHESLLKALSQNSMLDGESTMTEVSFNSIGPSIGRELTKKAIIAVVMVSLAIICFIAFSFRGVSNSSMTDDGPAVASWKYGILAIVALLHDVTIPIGIFAALSHFYGAEVDALFVVAILTILGLSVSDTIVIFDRIRENLKNQASVAKTKFSEIVGKSLGQSYMRSICTSLTVIIVLVVLFFFGPSTTKYFALMLTAGMFFGTYSSIFLASPLLVLVEEWQKKKK